MNPVELPVGLVKMSTLGSSSTTNSTLNTPCGSEQTEQTEITVGTELTLCTEITEMTEITQMTEQTLNIQQIESKEEGPLTFEDKIKQAWPDLDQIVTGFKKLQKKREREDLAIELRKQPLPLPQIAYDPHDPLYQHIPTLSHQFEDNTDILPSAMITNHIHHAHPQQIIPGHYALPPHQIQQQVIPISVAQPAYHAPHPHHTLQQQLHPNFLNNMHTAHSPKDHQIKFSKNMDLDDLPTHNLRS